MGNKISVNLQDNGKSYGDDIYLKYKDKFVVIPYEEKMDRDATIIWTNEIIKDDFSIRMFEDEVMLLDFACWQMMNGIC